jgi:hypothetical protein
LIDLDKREGRTNDRAGVEERGEGGGGDFTFNTGWGSSPWWCGSDRQPPIYTPPAPYNPPNPFSGETAGIPNGLSIPLQNPLSFLMPTDPSCDFGACGTGGSSFAGVDDAAEVALCVAQPEICGVIALTVSVAYLAHHYGVDAAAVQAVRSAFESRKADLAQVDRIAKEFCVDRNALGDAIHDEKKGGPKGKGGNLTEEEIRNIARRLPKIPGCTPTAQ